MSAIQAPPPLVPPFTRETAIKKVRLAEDGWNSRDPEKVALAYSEDSVWQPQRVRRRPRRDSGIPRRQVGPRTRLPAGERPVGFTDNRIAVRFQYEWHDAAGHWFRSYGNELWEFDDTA